MRRPTFLVAAIPLLAACESDSFSTPEPALLSTCAAPLIADALTSTNTTVDTTGGPVGPLALPECWGTADAANAPPQAAISYTVPGSGPTRTTIGIDAPPNLDVVIAVRRGGCATPVTARCFDVGEPGSLTLETEGGELLHLIVTAREGQSEGSDAVDVGVVQLTWSNERGAVPDLDSATIEVFQDRMYAELSGSDADADVMGALVWWLDGDGEPLHIDRAPDEFVNLMTFDADVHGLDDFDATSTATDYRTLETADVRGARVALIDDLGNESAPLAIDVARPVGGAVGDACDGDLRRCARQLECATDGACRPPSSLAAVCGRAETLEIPTPTTEATSVRRVGDLVPGDGVTHGSGACEDTPGIEHLYRVVVPEGRYDLIARTDIEGPGMGVEQDDVLYIRRTCDDPESQLACIDMGARSRLLVLDAEPGEHTVFVEDYHGVDAGDVYPYELEVALRPVLPTGSTCDVVADSLINRCAEGACTRDGVCP